MKFHLFCQGMTADEAILLTNTFNPFLQGIVFTDDIVLPDVVREQYSCVRFQSIEQLLRLINSGNIYLAGLPVQPFEFVSSLLESGANVILTAPLSFSLDQISALTSLADHSGAELIVDRGEFFHYADSRLAEWSNQLAVRQAVGGENRTGERDALAGHRRLNK